MRFLCAEVFDDRQCMICDCTTTNACVSLDGERTCAWVGDSLCDFCANLEPRRSRVDETTATTGEAA